MSFNQVLKDIKQLKIQGAQNIARESVNSLLFILAANKNKDASVMKKALFKARKDLFATRPTEPAMHNAVDFALQDIKFLITTPTIEKAVRERVHEVLNYFEIAQEKIITYGYQKIKSKTTVFTHCHSSTVVKIFKEAWKRGKRFRVNNTETRPMFQGRITAAELARARIPVTHFVDSAGRLAIKESSAMFIGADAITAKGEVINKVGSELYGEMAHKYQIPLYVCAHTWKFDPRTTKGYAESLEQRHASEVWPKAPKGVKISNFAFEKVAPELITGIICEYGIYKPETFYNVMQQYNPWMFSSSKNPESKTQE